MEYAIEINGLKKQYEDFVLKDVNIKVKQGTIMGFIGENGAGKSTTLKAMLNITGRDAGTVKILGMNIDENEIAIKQKIGVVLDECHYNDTFTPKAISSFLKGVYKNWDKEMYYNYLKKFKLPEKKIIKEFSRGMKMKLCIAIALSHHPELLILDEATSGLDPVVRNEILDVFFEYIQDENHSIIMSSHITTDIERICDYVTFIHQGEIVFSDNKDEILEKYGLLHCSKEIYDKLDRQYISGVRAGSFGFEVLVNDRAKVGSMYPELIMDKADLEMIMMYFNNRNTVDLREA